MIESCAVILGDYINGYAIVKELTCNNVKDIVIITYNKKIAFYSSLVSQSFEILQSKESLYKALKAINKSYSNLILFPTDDWYVDQITELEDDIRKFCFIPFNPENSKECSNKVNQYEYCKRLDVPFPSTINIGRHEDLDLVNNLKFPLIVKPVVRNDLSVDVFRSKQFNNILEFEIGKKEIGELIDIGIEFLISEVVPGTSYGNIYAYCAYIDKEGNILNEWVGRKLSQYPDDYGVFSSASNEAPEIVFEQGRKLVLGMGITGFCEPEFKYDYRDGMYKLMEVNLRSMMWNEVGRLSGVNLHFTQWQYARGKEVPQYIQNRSEKIVLFYFKHEFLNLIFLKGYFKVFKSIWREPNLYWAGCYKNDLKPLFVNVKLFMRTFVNRMLKG